LQAVAASLWGDSGLWYKLAQANGLSGDAALSAGQTLRIPAGVVRNTYNAATITPTDPADTLGDVNPTSPQAAPPKKQKCGVIGQILLVIIAVAVMFASQGTAAGIAANILGLTGNAAAVAAGAMAAAAGSVVSQVVGVATGIQDKFSWKSVALAAISGGVSGGMAHVLGPAQSMASAALRGAASSAISQGIGVALGLQDKFSWAAVAAAGVGAGIGHAVGGTQFAKSLTAKSEIAGDIYVGMADAMGQAATLSLIQGTDFGDNLIASLPSVLGGAIGRQLGGALQDGIRRNQRIDGLVAETGRSRSEVKQWVKDAEATGLDLAGRATNPGPQLEKARQKAEKARQSEEEIKQELLARRERFDRLEASLEKAGRANGPLFLQFKRTYEAALRSQDVYFDKTVPGLTGSQVRLEGDEVARATKNALSASMLVDAESGYFSAIYKDTKSGELFYVNRGTEGPFNTLDRNANIIQAKGLQGAQYERAMNNARALSGPSVAITFEGHSLGGGLATAQAIVSGYRALVFNAAGVHPNTVGGAAELVKQNDLVTNVIVKGDFLTDGQDKPLAWPSAGGRRVLLDYAKWDNQSPDGRSERPWTNFNPIDNHMMVAVLDSLFNRYESNRVYDEAYYRTRNGR